MSTAIRPLGSLDFTRYEPVFRMPDTPLEPAGVLPAPIAQQSEAAEITAMFGEAGRLFGAAVAASVRLLARRIHEAACRVMHSLSTAWACAGLGWGMSAVTIYVLAIK